VPLKYFAQQEVLNTFNAGSSAVQQVLLSGFRAGSVKDIMFWLEVQNDASGTGVSNGSKALVWPEILDAELKYNGEIFFTAPGQSARMWNLIEDKKRAGFSTSVIDYTANPATASDYFSSWTLVKFSQVDVPYDRMYNMVDGKPILNAVLNLSLTLPPEVLTAGVVTAGTKVILHAVYLYNCTILCSRGTSQYLF
jgi:hypothetical protein